jgi:hypothetical protein
MLPPAQRLLLARTLSRISATRDPSVGSGEGEAATLPAEPRLAVRRWLAVCPMAWLRARTRDPMHRLTAIRAVEHQPTELPFEIRLHVQEFEPQHLRLNRDGV